jgi:hypothetical protein
VYFLLRDCIYPVAGVICAAVYPRTGVIVYFVWRWPGLFAQYFYPRTAVICAACIFKTWYLCVAFIWCLGTVLSRWLGLFAKCVIRGLGIFVYRVYPMVHIICADYLCRCLSDDYFICKVLSRTGDICALRIFDDWGCCVYSSTWYFLIVFIKDWGHLYLCRLYPDG